jgi:hypothetical protein
LIITATINNVANVLPTGVYRDALAFSNHTSHVTQGRQAQLTVDPPPPVPIYAFPMDSDPGWTRQGQWEFGQPLGIGGDPSAGYTGTNVFGYNLSGQYSNSIPVYHLTTTALNFSGHTNVRLQFRRWLGIESATFDHANIQVSSNGVTWTTVWDHTGGSFSDTSWQLMDYDISAVADGQASVYVRWGMGPMDSSVTYCGWNIDDVVFLGSPAGTPVHHFAWSTIPTPQAVNVAFPVTITAQDASNATVTAFNSAVLLTGSTDGGAPVAISPLVSGNFSNGVWTGNITVLEQGNWMRLQATDATGATGLSGLFATLLDTDGDGMPNYYELANGFDPNDPTDGAVDADGDGHTNLQEYLAGTLPRNNASVLRVLNSGMSTNGFSLSFPTVAGKSYIVERKNDLRDPEWTEVETITGDGTVKQSLDAGAVGLPRRFYRVRVQ